MSSIDFYWVFADISRFSGVLGVLYFVFFMRKGRGISLIVFLILLASFLFDFGIDIYVKYIYPNSYFGSNWWLIINFLLMSALFYRLLERFKKLIAILVFVFIGTTVVTFWNTYSFWESNTVIRAISNFSFLILSGLGLRQLLNHPQGSLRKLPIFYVLVSFFCYYSLVLFIGLFLNYLVFELNVNSKDFTPIGYINLIANTSKNYLLFYALVLMHRNQESYRL